MTPMDSPLYDSEYKRLVGLEFNEIVDICQSYNDFTPVSGKEVVEAIKSLNTVTSGDILTNRQSNLYIVLNS